MDWSADALDLTVLAGVLGRVPNWRDRRGRRYRLGAVLALCLISVIGLFDFNRDSVIVGDAASQLGDHGVWLVSIRRGCCSLK
jgi:hypothetical protein